MGKIVSSKTQLAAELGVDISVLSYHFRKPGAPSRGVDGWDVDEIKRWHSAEIAKKGHLPRYDPPEAMDAREGSEPRQETPRDSLTALKLREAKAKAEERELKVARMRGEMIPRETVERVVREFAGRSKGRLLALVGQAPRLATMTAVPDIEELLRREILTALDELAKTPYTHAT